MRSQMEGSTGGRRDRRALPPAGHLRLPDLAADAHRRGALRARRSRHADAVRLHQRGVGVRRDVRGDRRLRGRRPRLHRHRQPGPALHGRGAVQRVRPGPADRDDRGQPGDRRARSTSGTTTATRCRSATPAGSSSTPRTTRHAADLHVIAFRLAEELSTPVMVCMDGFVLTHAFEPVDVARARTASTASCRAYQPRQAARPRRAGHHRRAWSGPRRSPRCGTWRTPPAHAALARFPELAAEYGSGDRSALSAVPAYRTTAPRPWSWRSARCSARSRTPSTTCAPSGVRDRRAGLTTFRPFPGRRVRAALAGADHGSSCWSGPSRPAWAGSSPPTSGGPAGLPTRISTVVAGLGGRAVDRRRVASRCCAARCRRIFLDRARRSTSNRSPRRFLDLDRDAVARTNRREVPAMTGQSREVLPDRQPRRRQPAARRRPPHRCRPIRTVATRSPPGHRACQGCGEALAARYVLDAAMPRHQGTTGGGQRHRLPGGVLHSVPGKLLAGAVAALAVRQRARGRHRRRRGPARPGTPTASACSAQGGDGGTVDIGFGCLSGMFERNDDVLFVCYDNQAYMNTGVQRSGATPPAARTATTQAVGPRPGQRVRRRARTRRASRWRTRSRTSRPPPSPTCTTSRQGLTRHGVARRPLPARARALPARLGSAPAETVALARLAQRSGLFPALRGRARRGHRGLPIRDRSRSQDYLRLQKRYAPPVRRPARAPTSSRDPGARRPQHPPATGCGPRRRSRWTSRLRSRWTSVPAWPTRPAPGAANGRSTSTGCRRATTPARPARTSSAGCTPAEDGELRDGVAAPDHGGQPVPRRHGPGLLPPVPDRVQPRPSSTRPWASTRSSGSSATRRSVMAGRCRRPAPPSGKRVLVVGAGPSGLSAAYHLRLLGHDVTSASRRAARRHDAVRHPRVPAAAGRARRRDPSGCRPRRHA